MRKSSRHERRLGSDLTLRPPKAATSAGSSPGTDYATASSYSSDGEEFVEVTLDIDDDDTVFLRSVGPAGNTSTLYVESDSTSVGGETTASASTSRLRQFSAEIMKGFSWSQEFAAKILSRSSSLNEWYDTGFERAVATRYRRKQQARFNRTRPGAQKALKGLRFISGEGNASWMQVEHEFERLVKEDGCLLRSDFAVCIGMKDSKEFALELFDALSRRRRLKVEKISKEELFDYWGQITDDGFDSRLQIFFDMVDKDEDGRLTEKEVEEIITLSASANRLSRLKKQAGEYATLIMEELDREGFGYIELWQLETLLLQKDTYLSHSQALSYTSQALSQSLQGLRYRSPIQRMRNKLFYFLKDNWKRVWVLSLWILVMIGLFTWKFIQYRYKNAFKVMSYCLPIAKGAAETLKLNMALILFPVCRNTITWLRSTKVGHFLPFNDNINFHKTIAGAIMIGVLLHVGNHLACDFVRLERSSLQDYNNYLSDFGTPKPTYADLVRGYEGVTGIIMVVLMAIAFTLASRYFRLRTVKLPEFFNRLTGFNAFWYSHHLFVIVYICLLIHGMKLYLIHERYHKTTWMYLAVPVALYAGERTLRFFRSELYDVSLLKVALYPGDVLTLQMSKPSKFRYKSGQYMFVQCPAVSPFEWHPFSITSAPGDDFLSVHIRKLGDWTAELHSVFSEFCKDPDGRSELLRVDETTRESLPKLLIDGPYGAPTQDYHDYDVLLLAGLGIGATPIISIVKDLLNNIVKEEEEREKATNFYPIPDINIEATQRNKKPLRTTNAYVYWVTKDQVSLDWFKGVMNEVAEVDQRGVIEMHNYLTSVYEEGDARSALVTLVAALNKAKNGVDVLSGTTVRTHFARPKWKKVLAKVASKHANARIGVFYCGLPICGQELKALCKEFNQNGTAKFEFHKENF